MMHTVRQQTSNSKYTKEQSQRFGTKIPVAGTQESREDTLNRYVSEFGYSRTSLIAKLSSEGVYIRKPILTKSGDSIVRKCDLVSKLAELMGEDEDVVGSLEKVTKPVLQKLIDKLTNQ